jgi:predicted PurR-regulated permease PerM
MARFQSSSSPLVILVAALAVVAALYFAQAILMPLALAILLTFLLTPLANRVERWGLPRVPAVIVVGGVSFAIIGVLIWIVAIQAINLGANVDSYQENFFGKVRALGGESGTIGKITNRLAELSEKLADEIKWLPQSTGSETGPPTGDEALEVKVVNTPSPLTQIGNWLGPVTAPLSAAGLVVVLVLFMLIEREDQRNRLIELFGSSNLNLTTEALSDAARRVTRFLRMQFMINAGYGVCVAVALSLLGVPSAVMWGVLGFMLRFLPYIGPILAAILPIGISVAVSPGWTQPLLVAGWFIVLELVLNNLIEPWLYGSSIGVSAVGILIAAIFWTWLWGPLGLLLAMPLTVCLVVLARYVPQLRFITVLLSDEPALSPAQNTYQRLLAMDDNEIRRQATQFLKSAVLAAYYDDVLIPALSLAERDRHAGELTEDQEAFLDDLAEDLPEELEPAASREAHCGKEPSAGGSQAGARAHVFCIPQQDRADQATASMLSQLLAANGLRVDVGSADSLTNELVDEVAHRNCNIAVISILSPSSPRNSRLLRRRLHERFPDLKVIIGYWGALHGERLERRFGLGDSDQLVTRLSDCVEIVRRAAAGMSPHVDTLGGVVDNGADSSSPQTARIAIASDHRR